MEHRVFTVEEANEVLPKLEEIFSRIDQQKDRLRLLQTQVSILRLLWAEKIREPHNPDHEEFLAHTREHQAGVEEMKELVREIQEMGCLAKDLDQGLVDFYSRRAGRIVFLCWRRGEKKISFWHELHSGYSGRVPL
ncbi:MAG: DUF2203 domain-containing protein [Candidatus Eisenbacteria bacterium]|nr:DUF2203 domain-containing protein [Candidatus Eisenbacteria bacterium]